MKRVIYCYLPLTSIKNVTSAFSQVSGVCKSTHEIHVPMIHKLYIVLQDEKGHVEKLCWWTNAESYLNT